MLNNDAREDLFKFQNTAPNFLDIRKGSSFMDQARLHLMRKKGAYCWNCKWEQKGQHGNKWREVSSVNKERHRDRSD